MIEVNMFTMTTQQKKYSYINVVASICDNSKFKYRVI